MEGATIPTDSDTAEPDPEALRLNRSLSWFKSAQVKANGSYSSAGKQSKADNAHAFWYQKLECMS